MDKYDDFSRKAREFKFNRSLNVDQIERKLVVPRARNIRSVFSNVIDDSSVSKAPASAPIQPTQITQPVQKVAESPIAKTPVKTNVKANDVIVAPQAKAVKKSPAVKHHVNHARKVHDSQIRVNNAHKTVNSSAMMNDIIAAKPVSLADALNEISAPEVDLFAPNAVDPTQNKLQEKPSRFAKNNKIEDVVAVKPPVKSHANEKRIAKALKKASAAEAKKKNREARENLIEANIKESSLNESFAAGLMAAAAETNDEFANAATGFQSEGAAVLEQTVPKLVLNIAGKDFAIGGAKKEKAKKSNIEFVVSKDVGSKSLAALRALAIVVILAVSGYLAWDTWMTNRDVQSSFSNASGAMSIAASNPSTADPTAVSAEQYSAYTTPADEPRYIRINSIGVKARVQKVGVTSSGNIDAPAKLADTAWYDGSAKPGQDGQTFIDGHTSFNNSPASFNDLPKLVSGDQITIETGDGSVYNYRVVQTETVATGDVSMEKALNVPDGATKGLTLMTCTGKYNYQTQDADKRFIVYAVQE